MQSCTINVPSVSSTLCAPITSFVLLHHPLRPFGRSGALWLFTTVALLIAVHLVAPIDSHRIEAVNHAGRPQPPSRAIYAHSKRVCSKLSFELYDGYEWLGTEDFAVASSYLHFTVEDLPECLRLCQQNQRCVGVNYEGITCQQVIEHEDDGDDEKFLSQLSNNTVLVKAFNIHAHKICITDHANRCAQRLWAFEHVIGYQLSYPHNDHFSQRKKMVNIDSTGKCRQLCLDEQRFTCRSATYDAARRECLLSDMNRHTIENTYSDRVELANSKTLKAKFVRTEPFNQHVHYLENKCHQEPRKFCDFRRLRHQRLKTADRTESNVQSLSECRELCVASHENLACKSFDYNQQLGVCRLSHLSESSTLHVREPYLLSEETTTFEISTCYNVTISCLPRTMLVAITTSRLFNGKIYAKSQPKQCATDIDNSLRFELSMPYHDDLLQPQPAAAGKRKWTRGGEGELVQENEMPASGNGRQRCDTRQPVLGQFANDIVIQHHDLVMTTKDLSLGVFCKFDLANDSITRIDLRIQGDIMTDQLKGNAKLPKLSLHVVDGKGREIDEVGIGDILRLQVLMSDEDTYGIFVRNLIARDSFNHTNNMTLIDSKGCPVEVKMLREMRTLDDHSKSLESYFEAFTFTGGSLMVIEAEVETCLDKCKPVECKVATGRSDDAADIVTSYGRRRRRRRRRRSTSTTDKAVEGDVLSMTMLSKSLLIRPARDTPEMGRSMELTPTTTTTSSSSVSKTPTIIRRRTSSSSSSPRTPSALQEGKSLESRASAPFLKVTLGNKDYICFEPINLLIIGCLSFLVQGCVFALVFYVLVRIKLSQYKSQLSLSWRALDSGKNIFGGSHHHHQLHNTHQQLYRGGAGGGHNGNNNPQPYNFMR